MTIAGPGLVLLIDFAAGTRLWSSAAVGWWVPITAFVLGVAACLLSRKNGRGALAVGSHAAVSPLPTYREAANAFERELERARRNERAFAVLALRLDDDELAQLEARLRGENGSGSSETLVKCTVQAAYLLAGSILRERLREIDVATSDVVNRRFVVALPESDTPKALETGRRMAELILRGTGIRTRFAVAEFRKDGVLVEDLIQRAVQSCGEIGIKESWKTAAVGVVRPNSSELPSPG